MPRYSDELIEEVRSRNDIVDVISQYVRLSKKGSTYFGLCPFHNEKTGSFSVSPNKQMYYCFGCHAGGNVFTFLMQYENYTFGEAMEALAERAGVDLPKQEYTAAQRQEADRRARHGRWRAKVSQFPRDEDFRQEPQSLRTQFRTGDKKAAAALVRGIYGCDCTAPGRV